MATNHEEPKRRRAKEIQNPKVDKTSPAYRIIIRHLGGLTEASRIIDRKTITIYGWLTRGSIPEAQRGNVSRSAAAANKAFPESWYERRSRAKAA